VLTTKHLQTMPNNKAAVRIANRRVRRAREREINKLPEIGIQSKGLTKRKGKGECRAIRNAQYARDTWEGPRLNAHMHPKGHSYVIATVPTWFNPQDAK